MKLIYLASPYSSPNELVQDMREIEITRIAAHLTKKFGYAMILPITQSAAMVRVSDGILTGGTFADWAKIDLFFIEKSDEVWVAMMDGWDKSIGVLAEIRYAQDTCKAVRYIDPQTLEFCMHRTID